MPDLEERVGSLAGQLKNLVPALERMETRQNALSTEVASLGADIRNLKDALSTLRGGELRDIFQRLNAAENLQGTLQTSLNGLIRECKGFSQKSELEHLRRECDGCARQSDVEDLKRKSESAAKKMWDVMKVLLAAVVGASATLALHALQKGGSG